MRKWIAALAGLCGLFWPPSAIGQPVGQLGPGQLWGNPTGTPATARPTNVQALCVPFGVTLPGCVPAPGSAGHTLVLWDNGWGAAPSGSSGTPGNPLSTMQWNNAGAFAGATFSAGTSDCAFTFTAPTTGTIICTKTNLVPFAASATTDTTQANNITGNSLNNARLTTGFINTGVGLTPASTAIAGGGTLAADFATAAQFTAGQNNKVLNAGAVFLAEGTIAVGSTITLDFSTFINAYILFSGGNITTINFSNVKAGQSGLLRFQQDGSGSRTIPATINALLKCAGGCNYTLTTTANAVDVIPYSCVTATFCIGGGILKDVK